MEESRLTHDQTRYIFETNIIGKDVNTFQARFLSFFPIQETLLLDIESQTPSKMKSGKILSIYDFFQHNLPCPIVDTVHGSNPGHLVCCFQFLSHALSDLHLLNNQGQTLLRLLVQIGKVSPESDNLANNSFNPFLNIFNRWQLLFQIIRQTTGYFIFAYTNRL